MNHFAAIQKALEENGLDAVLLTCQANRFYASGFQSTGTDGACLVARDAVLYWTDGRYIEAAGNEIQGAEVALTDRQHPYKDLFAQAEKRLGIQKMGFDDEAMTVYDYETYRKALASELVPASKLMAGLRAVKDEEELRRMVRAQRIAEKALTEVLNDIRPGVSERFLAARLTYLMLAGGAENVSFDPIVISGAKTSMPHGVPSDKPVEDGDFVTMDFGALFGGYCSDMTRTVAVGHATEEMEKIYDVVLRAQLAGIAACRAGVAGKAVDQAARDVIEAAGYGPYFCHGFGHSVGVEIHESPNANQANDKPLPAGAAVSAEPGIYIPGKFGVRIEDVVVVRDGGCENLTLAPKALTVL